MPHDANGVELKVGDKVAIPAIVKQLNPGEEYCNASVETVYAMPPYTVPQTISSINTRQLVKVEEAQG